MSRSLRWSLSPSRLPAVATIAGAMMTLMMVSACSDTSPTANEETPMNVVLSIDDVSGQSILVDPRNATLQVGYGAIVEARILDAGGSPIPGARPVWSTSDASIATVSALPDSGLRQDGLRAAVAARAAGSVLIIASHANKADTARFTITSVRVDSGSQGPVTRPARFDLVAQVLGRAATSPSSRDSSTWTPPVVAGATVRFVQLPSIAGDTLPPTAPPVSAPTLIATATADATGMVHFSNMPAARFRLEVDPPSASAWAARVVEYGAPYASPLRLDLLLSPKP